MKTGQLASNSERLFVLMYSSTATDAAITRGALESILEQARDKNARLGITGILLFREGRFFQYLEGPEAAVKSLYEDIEQDPRHHHLRVLLETHRAERRFSEWTMGYEELRNTPVIVPDGFRSTFADLEDTERPDNVLRAVVELTYWYRARAARV